MKAGVVLDQQLEGLFEEEATELEGESWLQLHVSPKELWKNQRLEFLEIQKFGEELF